MAKYDYAPRKRAVLAGLRHWGNVTLAAERAKVSRSWVERHRGLDPAFDAACREAIASALDALNSSDRTAPSRGWGTLDGVELVVRGAPGRRQQVRRARLHGWSPSVERRFLSVLAATCNAKAACAEVGLTQASAYHHRTLWPAFAKRWDDAIEGGGERLETGLVEAGCNLFSDTEQPPEATVSSITAAEALHQLYMYKRRMTGFGKRQGGPYKVASNAEIIAALEKRLRQFGVKV